MLIGKYCSANNLQANHHELRLSIYRIDPEEQKITRCTEPSQLLTDANGKNRIFSAVALIQKQKHHEFFGFYVAGYECIVNYLAVAFQR